VSEKRFRSVSQVADGVVGLMLFIESQATTQTQRVAAERSPRLRVASNLSIPRRQATALLRMDTGFSFKWACSLRPSLRHPNGSMSRPNMAMTRGKSPLSSAFFATPASLRETSLHSLHSRLTWPDLN
jgi:hypothetical protein